MSHATTPNAVLSIQVHSGQAAGFPGPSHALHSSPPPVFADHAVPSPHHHCRVPVSVRGPPTHAKAYQTLSSYIPRAGPCSELQGDHGFASSWSFGSNNPVPILASEGLLDGFQSPVGFPDNLKLLM